MYLGPQKAPEIPPQPQVENDSETQKMVTFKLLHLPSKPFRGKGFEAPGLVPEKQ